MNTNTIPKTASTPLDDKNLVGHLIGHPINSQGQYGTHITGISDAPTNIPNSNNPAYPVSQYDVQMAKRLQDAGKTLAADTDNTVKALVRIVNQAGHKSPQLSTSLHLLRDIATMGNMSALDIQDHISSLRATGSNPAPNVPFMAAYSVMSDSQARKTLHDLLEGLKHLVVEKEPPHSDGVSKAIADLAVNPSDPTQALEKNKNLADVFRASEAFNKAADFAEKFKAINPNSRNASIKRIASAYSNIS